MLANFTRDHYVIVGVVVGTIYVTKAQKIAIQSELKLAHRHEQSHLRLFFKTQIEFLLGPSFEERVNDFVEDLGHLALMLQLLLLSPLKELGFLFNLKEEILIVEDLGHDEVEQAPKFLEVVIKRSSCE